MGPVVVAMTNTVGRVELLTWLKTFLAQIPGGEVRPIQLLYCRATIRRILQFIATIFDRFALLASCRASCGAWAFNSTRFAQLSVSRVFHAHVLLSMKETDCDQLS